MAENKLDTITNIFQGNEIRSVWDPEKEDYYFSVIDVIKVLTDSKDPSDYWTTLKRRLKENEKSELPTICRKLKMKTTNGRRYPADTLDTEGIFRLIESVPSPKAEPFKIWLAKLGRQEVDNIFDPSKGIDKMLDYYLQKGYSLEWIEVRIKAIINRKKLTNTWKENGIENNNEYAILTNEIYREWSGMKATEYKIFKGIKKESLRDNMSDIEIALTDLGEIATRDIAKKEKPIGLKENLKVAKRGGSVSKKARECYEKETGESAIQSVIGHQNK